MTRNYYVRTDNNKVSYTSGELTSINSAAGTSTGDKFTFIQQVFYTVFTDASLLTASEATINV